MITRTLAPRHLFAAAAVVALVAPQVVQAQAQSYDLDIPAQNLDAALKTLAGATGQQVAFRGAVVRGKRSAALKGRLTIDQALALMLAGSGLAARRVADGVFVIEAVRSDMVGNGDVAADGIDKDIVVTGSHIRGSENASSTIIIGQKQFKEQGFNDLGEVIRTIPQNFRGGQNPGIAAGASLGGASNYNRTGGSALNLRGLGPDATLTLLNGRRVSYDGSAQTVDISAIPIDAVERLEIVPDGASAIYGSDAVGGVANLILKRDFRGITMGSLYGDSKDGGLRRHNYNATAGATWSSGGFIATYVHNDQDPIYADQRSYTQGMYDPNTIYSGENLNSGLVSAHQMIGSIAELQIDGLYTRRKQTIYIGSNGPYYVEPRDTKVTLLAPSVRFRLPHTWSLIVGGSTAQDKSVNNQYSVSHGVPSAPGGKGCFCNNTNTWGMDADGPLVGLGQREVRLAIGIGGRRDELHLRHYPANASDTGGEQSSRFAYGEISLPLVGPDNAMPGIRHLEFNAAVRAEKYDGSDPITTPKMGVIYDPTKDFTIKATWGRSFKNPTLFQLTYLRAARLYTARQLGCASCAANSTVLVSLGGNASLEPERARTWSASVDLHPTAIPSLNLELSYFNVDYIQRIAQPINVLAQALSDPANARFISYNPTSDDQAKLLALYNYNFFSYAGAYNSANVVAIVANQYANVARQKVQGIDFSGNYAFDLGAGRVRLEGNASWLDLSQQNSIGQPEFAVSGKIFRPASLNGRFSGTWIRGGLSVSASTTYVSGVTNTLGTTPDKTDSFTTFDMTVRYGTKPGNRLLSGLTFALSVDNLFDRHPPLYTPPSPIYAPYDSTNYSAIGRYVTLSISKHFF